jgi:Uma2 family endonuclease
MTAVTLKLDPIVKLTRDAFYKLCEANPDLSFERTAQGELVIVTPVGGGGSSREADLIVDVGNWNRQTQLGIVFSSSGLFSLPNGGDRCPDVAWITLERWQSLSLEEQEGVPNICPDFVIELRSHTDRLQPLQVKMQEYLNSGLRLGWLIDPQNQRVEIYRLGQPVEILNQPQSVSGEDVLPGFVLNVSRFWT